VDLRDALFTVIGGTFVFVLLFVLALIVGPPESVVQEVEVEVPRLFLVGVPVPGAPLQLSENEELGAFSDPAGEFYCFPVEGAGF
jgi:hypothetical protein